MAIAKFRPTRKETPEWIWMILGIYNYVAGLTTQCKYMSRCNSVFGLGERVTCHMFWFDDLLLFTLYLRSRLARNC